MDVTFPQESAEYRAARLDLLERERELRRATEEVAARRRLLPPGGEVAGPYVFDGLDDDGAPARFDMLDLFTGGHRSLALYSMMFGPDRETPCPACVTLVDGLDGAVRQIERCMDLAVVVDSPLPRVLEFARDHGWDRIRLLSAGATTYTRDYLGVTPDGWDGPMMNVFERSGDTIRHFWGSELLYAETEPGQDFRHNDPLMPLWGMLDLTPEGRHGFVP